MGGAVGRRQKLPVIINAMTPEMKHPRTWPARSVQGVMDERRQIHTDYRNLVEGKG